MTHTHQKISIKHHVHQSERTFDVMETPRKTHVHFQKWNKIEDIHNETVVSMTVSPCPSARQEEFLRERKPSASI